MGEAAVVYPAGKLERELRLNTQEHCVITRQDGTVVTAILRNISERGFCVESATPLDKHEQVHVRVLGARLQGAVKWAEGCRAGGTLHQVEG
jgi:hypothetical protein